MDIAALSGVATGVQLCRMPNWGVADFGLTPMLGTIAIGNFTKAIKKLIELQPIRKRAIQIKNAAKHLNKNI